MLKNIHFSCVYQKKVVLLRSQNVTCTFPDVKIGCKGTTKNPNKQENREKTSIILGFATCGVH